MNKKLLVVIFIAIFLCSVVIVPQISYCQTDEPTDTPSGEGTLEPTPTEEAQQGSGLDFLLIVAIIVVVVVIVGAVTAFVFVKRKQVNEKSLRRFSPREFQDWVIKRFNGKPSDPSSGVDGFTEGGQPLLIKQSDNVSLAEVEGFVNVLAKGKAQKGTIVAFNFDNDAVDGKVTAMDNGIELQMLRIYELLNKRYSDRIKDIACSQVTFEAPPAYTTDDPVTETFEKTTNEPQKEGLKKPLVFISQGSTNIANQTKKMLEFLHYDYVVGDKEDSSVPISENKFGLMKDCDCAIIDISAAEQERRYSGIYILNSTVVSEISAAYLKYNTQVILLVEKKVDLPSNLKGLKRIEYDNDDLPFTAAIDLEKALAGYKKM